MSRRAPLTLRVFLILVSAGLASACGRGFPTPEFPPFEPIAEPSPETVDAVIFLVGDAGATPDGGSPLLARLGADVERWSAALGRDSAVAVAFLGDNVYPDGVRPRSHPLFPTDSARLWNQIELLAGPEARRHRTSGWFLAGNHDWGSMIGSQGLARLRNEEVQLERANADGLNVAMVPEAGSPGPVMRDIGEGFRLVFIDTHWFLQDPVERERTRYFDRLKMAFEDAGDREILVVSHHPWATSGPHGVSEGGRALGYYWLLEKTGTLVQDLNSPVYDGFIRSFRQVVRESGRRPFAFAGGHDHSLQVFEGVTRTDPSYSLVSGAGSKLSPVSDADGLRYAASRPGYMTLFFRAGGGLDLFVTAGSPDHLACRGSDRVRARCMREGVDAFETVYSATLEASGRSTAP